MSQQGEGTPPCSPTHRLNLLSCPWSSSALVGRTRIDGKSLSGGDATAHNGGVDTRDVVVSLIAPDDLALARRILALLWSYERANLRQRQLREALHRRKAEPSDEAAEDSPRGPSDRRRQR
jgi:hypothetical protein